MNKMNDILDLLGRLLISVIFVFEAYDSFAFYGATKEKMISYGITWYPEFWLILSLFFLCIGGIFLLLGYRARMAALFLLLYWVPLTFTVYSFWNDPIEIRRMNSIMFMKNIAICGGLLMIIVNGSGKYSVKRLLDRRRVKTRF